MTGGKAASRGYRERRRLVVEFVLLAGSTALFQATRLGAGIAGAALLTPAEYAEWGLTLAILGYSVYANFGLASGLNRELPRVLGRGDVDGAEAIERAGRAGSLITAMTTVALIVAAGWGAGLSAGMIVATAAAAGTQQIYLFSQAVLRSRLRFNRASLQQAVLAAVFPLVSLALIGWLGVMALAVGQTAAYAVGAVFAGRSLWRAPLGLMPDGIRRLMRIGIPIMGAGLGFALLTTLDRWIVHILLGDTATGRYTIAALLSSSALLVSMVVAQQFYPRMAYAVGRGADAKSLVGMASTQSAVVIGLIVPVSVFLVIAVPSAIERHLPAYEAAIPTLQVLAIGFIPLVAASGFSNYLVVVGRSGMYLVAICGALAVELVVAIQLVPLGMLGVATAALAAYAYLLAAVLVLTVATASRS